jgi:glycosyltransferase involved in cell wall biosynthesis
VTTFTAIRIAQAHLRHPQLRLSTLVIDDHMSEAVSLRKVRWFYPAFRSVLMPVIRRSADSLVAVSDDTKSFMMRHYGLNANEIKVIRLGVDEKRFRPDPVARKSVRQSLLIPDDAVLVIYTGKIIPRKQVDILLKAIGMLAEDFPPLQLLVVGYAEPDYLARLKVLADELKIGNRIFWHGAVTQTELPAYFAAADIAVWPAEHSISFLEAMASGLPLVVANTPKSGEEVRYENGFIFQEGNIDDITSKLKVLISSSQLRESMGMASREAVEQHYSWHKIATQFLYLYQNERMFDV